MLREDAHVPPASGKAGQLPHPSLERGLRTGPRAHLVALGRPASAAPGVLAFWKLGAGKIANTLEGSRRMVLSQAPAEVFSRRSGLR
jgi:hypothetical protein